MRGAPAKHRARDTRPAEAGAALFLEPGVTPGGVSRYPAARDSRDIQLLVTLEISSSLVTLEISASLVTLRGSHPNPRPHLGRLLPPPAAADCFRHHEQQRWRKPWVDCCRHQQQRARTRAHPAPVPSACSPCLCRWCPVTAGPRGTSRLGPARAIQAAGPYPRRARGRPTRGRPTCGRPTRGRPAGCPLSGLQ